MSCFLSYCRGAAINIPTRIAALILMVGACCGAFDASAQQRVLVVREPGLIATGEVTGAAYPAIPLCASPAHPQWPVPADVTVIDRSSPLASLTLSDVPAGYYDVMVYCAFSRSPSNDATSLATLRAVIDQRRVRLLMLADDNCTDPSLLSLNQVINAKYGTNIVTNGSYASGLNTQLENFTAGGFAAATTNVCSSGLSNVPTANSLYRAVSVNAVTAAFFPSNVEACVVYSSDTSWGWYGTFDPNRTKPFLQGLLNAAQSSYCAPPALAVPVNSTWMLLLIAAAVAGIGMNNARQRRTAR